MEEKKGRTWEDVRNEMDAHSPQDATPCGVPDAGREAPAAADVPPVADVPSDPHTGPHGGPGHMPPPPDGCGPHRHAGRGRLTAYLLLSVALNFVLAIYMLFILSLSLEAVAEMLGAGQPTPLARRALMLLVMLSPLLFTILFNRLLFALMRGRRRFSRGMGLFAVVLILIVQALTVYVVFTAGAAPALESFEVESFTAAAY